MSWWSRLFRRSRMEEQLEKELRFHLEEHENAVIARGHSPAEARREARLALGGPEQVKEKCRDARGTRWAEELLQDTSYALRTFRQKPGFVATTVLILALGIGATTVMFAVINGVLLRPLPFLEPSRLVILHGSIKDMGEFWGFSYPDFTEIKHEIQSVRIAGWTDSSGTIGRSGNAGACASPADLGGTLARSGNRPLVGARFSALRRSARRGACCHDQLQFVATPICVRSGRTRQRAYLRRQNLRSRWCRAAGFSTIWRSGRVHTTQPKH